MAADQCGRVVSGLDAGEHLPGRVFTNVEQKTEQLFRPFDMAGIDNTRHAQVNLHEIVDADCSLVRVVCRSGFSGRRSL